MAKKKDDKKAKKDAWRQKKRAEAPIRVTPEAKKAYDEFMAGLSPTTKVHGVSPESFQKDIEIRAKMSPAVRAEFSRLWAAKVEDIRATTDPDAEISLNQKEIIEEAERRVRQRQDVRKYQSQKHEKPEDQSLETYLEAIAYTLRVSRQEANTDRRAEAMRMYVAFREARVFHIGQETYAAVHQEADRFTTELSGLDYQPPNLRREVPQEENARYVTTFIREAKHQAWPEKFPFPVIYLGYGQGVVLPLESGRLKAPSTVRDDVEEVRVLGHLLTAEGHALTWLQAVVRGPDNVGVIQWCDEARTIEAGWTRGLDLEPWTLPHLVRIINDHRTFVIETEVSGAVRRSIRENRKPLGLDDYKHMPKPYYSLRLQTHVIRDKVRKQLGRPSKPKSYKTDVRGHERCRIRRGPLPIDPKLADKLQKRGYVIFSTTTLDEKTFQRLTERGMAFKRADEWLAVKASWVKDHLSSNNPNVPYIPALRVAGAVQAEPKKQTGSWVDDPASR